MSSWFRSRAGLRRTLSTAADPAGTLRRQRCTLRRNTLSHFDNRLSRETVTPTGSSFDYGYDLSGFVNGNGTARNYVWLGDIPLAVIDQNSDGSLAAMYYIETDFENNPRYLRRASGGLDKAVWHWPLAPYGDTPALEDPDGDGGKVIFNLRYPGQYDDSFFGLHHNPPATSRRALGAICSRI